MMKNEQRVPYMGRSFNTPQEHLNFEKVIEKEMSKDKNYEVQKSICLRFARVLMQYDEFKPFYSFEDVFLYLKENYFSKFFVGNYFYFPNNMVHVRFKGKNRMRVDFTTLSEMYHTFPAFVTFDQIGDMALHMGTIWSMIFRPNIEEDLVIQGFFAFSYQIYLRIIASSNFSKRDNIVEFLGLIKNKNKIIFLPRSYTIRTLMLPQTSLVKQNYTEKQINDFILTFEVNRNFIFDDFVKNFKLGFIFPKRNGRNLPTRKGVREKLRGMAETGTLDLTSDELFVSLFVLSLQRTGDIGKTFCEILPELNRPVFNESFKRKIMERIAEFDFFNYNGKSLVRSYSNIRFNHYNPEVESKPTIDKLTFINSEGRQYRDHCRNMEVEAKMWAEYFEIILTRNIFFNVDRILMLMRVTDKEIPSSIPIVNLSDTDVGLVDEGSMLMRMYNGFCSPYRELKRKMTSILQNTEITTENTKQISEKMLSYFEQFNKDLAPDLKMRILTDSISDFSTIKASFQSIRLLINSMFKGMIKQIQEIFGLSKEMVIPQFTDLFMIYLTWINTDSKTLKVMLILDLAATMGFLDYILDLLKSFWFKIKDFMDSIFNTGIEEFRSQVKKFTEKNDAKLRKPIEEIEKSIDEVDVERPKIGWFEAIVDALETGTPFVLGVLGLILLGKFAIEKTAKPKEVGMDIIKTARNLSYISLGLAAVPKIFQNISAVVFYVIDVLKSKFKKDYKTRLETINEVNEWIKGANYTVGYSPSVFASDPMQCLIFLRHYAKITDMALKVQELKDPHISRFFFDAKRVMDGLITQVRSSMRVHSNIVEPCHFQLVSEIPGVGKTDTTAQMVHVIKDKLQEMSQKYNITRDVNKEDITRVLSNAGGVMYFNDNTKFVDFYQYQEIGVFDEINTFMEPEQDSVVNKMMMLSGNPCLVNKASLEDKGMLYETKVFISCSNVKTPNCAGMENKNAYLRRRNLIEVKVKPEFMTRDNKVDWDKVSQNCNRTKGEHLLFYILQSTPVEGQDKYEHDPMFPDPIPMHEFLEYVSLKLEMHIVREEARLLEKDKLAFKIRKQYDLVTSLIKKCIVKPVTSEIENITTIIDKAISDIDSLEKPHQHFKELQEKLFQICKQIFKDNPIFEKYSKTNFKDSEGLMKIISTVFDQLALNEEDELTRVECFESHKGLPYPCKECDGCLIRDVLNIFIIMHSIEPFAKLSDLTNIPLVDMEDSVQNLSDENVGIGFISMFYSGGHYSFKRVFDLAQHHSIQSFEGLDLSPFFVKDRMLFYDSPVGEIKTELKSKVLGFAQFFLDTCGYDMEVDLKKYQRKDEIKRLKQKGEWALKQRVSYIMETTTTCQKFIKDVLLKTLGVLYDVFVLTSATVLTFGALYGVGCLLVGNRNVSYNQNERALPTIVKGSAPVKVRNLASIEPNIRYSQIDDVKATQKYIFKVFSLYPDKMTIRGRATMVSVGGSIFLTVKHFTQFFEEKQFLAIYDPLRQEVDCSELEKYFRVEITKKHVVDIPDADLSLVYIPDFRSVRNGLPHFLKEEDLGQDFVNFSYTQASAVVLRESSRFSSLSDINKDTGKYKFSNLPFSSSSPTKYYNYKSGEYIPAERVFKVVPNSSDSVIPGDSGCPVMHLNSKTQSRNLLGLCIAKDEYITNNYYVNIVTQEQIEAAKQQFPFESKILTCYYENESLDSEHQLHKVFEIKDNLRKSPIKDLSISSTSGFRRSPIFGVFPVESEPAIQNGNDARILANQRHFLKVSLNKYNGTQSIAMSIEDKEIMKRFHKMIYRNQFLEELLTLRVYSPREATVGVRMVGSVPINYHSSAGLPYSIQPGVKGKSPYIQFDEQTQTINVKESVYFDLEYYTQSYLQGMIPHNFKSEYRKKELVGLNKILEPKTRTIGTGNMIHQIMYNRVFKDLMTKMKNVWSLGRSSSFALGVDMEKHAHAITKYLKWHDCVFDFDVKSWEKSINQMLCDLVITSRAELILDSYYARGEKCPLDIIKLMKALTVDFMDSDYIFENVLNHKMSGLLSGHPGTFLENSDIHLVLIYLIIYKIIRKSECLGKSFKFIYDNVRILVAADDIVLSLSPNIRDFVTIEKIRSGYSDCGFTITSADKTDVILRKTIEECQFLKHTFRFTGFDLGEPIYVGSPNASIIYQLLNWVNADSKLASREQFLINVTNAFRFAFWRGEEFYEDLRSRFNKVGLSVGIIWEYDYSEMRTVIDQAHVEEDYLKAQNSPILNFKHSNQDEFFLEEVL